MKDMAEQVLQLFQKQPYAEIATTDLIKQFYAEEYEKIKNSLHDPNTDKEARIIAKRHKGQLHRRLLYHINRLVEEGKINVSSIRGKGEKCYALTHQQRQEKNFSIAPTPLTEPLEKLEQYHKKGILTMYDKKGWHHRLNAVLLEIQRKDTTTSLLEKIKAMSTFVNDVIGIHHMEELIEREDIGTLTAFLKKLDIETRDNNKTISLLIDTSEQKDIKYLDDFFGSFTLLKPSNINIIISTTPKLLEKHQRTIKHIIKLFAEATIKLNIHDKAARTSPTLIGKAGNYTLTEEEWNDYEAQKEHNTTGICIGQISMGIDIERFFTTYKNDNTRFRSIIQKMARTLVECTTLQRRRANNAFKELNQLIEKPQEFFKYSTNYIRIWNYDWEEIEHPHFSELIASCNEELEHFYTTEETIFKSCGIPIRFKVSMGSMFSRFAQQFFSKRNYQKYSIQNIAGLQEKYYSSFMTAREKIIRNLHYNDRIRVFRITPLEPEDVIKEMKYLLETYTIPHLNYDFSERKINMTLDQFIKRGLY